MSAPTEFSVVFIPASLRITDFNARQNNDLYRENAERWDNPLVPLANVGPRTLISSMRIALGSDHAGFDYKEQIKALLRELGHDIRDFGTQSNEPVDYPLFIRPVAEAVARGEYERGIVLGGSGNGEAIVANKVRGIRCALCWSLDTARWAREHNDSNVLALGQRTISAELALDIVRVWLTTPFSGGRHAARVKRIEE